jgi:propionate CoA-transferase
MQIISADAAASLVQDGWTVATAGFSSSGIPEAVTEALERRFLTSGAPRDLTLIHAAGQGNRTVNKAGGTGVAHFAHSGMTRRVIGGHWGGSTRLADMAMAGEIEGYNLPQGVISQLYRATAGGKLGLISPIGLHTFVDPRHDGGRLGKRVSEDLVDLITLRGREYLFYAALPIQCGIIRATTADTRGNLTAEHETVTQDMLAIAQAARNSGGIVIAQVKRLTEAGALHPHMVRVPGILVDYVVLAEGDHHRQTAEFDHNPAFTGEIREPHHSFQPLPLDVRKIIARRAAFELLPHRNPVVNLGTGIPASVAAVAREEGILDMTFTVEAGTIGGFPAAEPTFGAAINPEAIIDQPSQFDFYDGGGLDISFLGLGEVDSEGSVNVSCFGPRFNGVGGFINITQSTKTLVFCGTFTGQGLEVRAGDGLEIIREGSTRKFVDKVHHLSFNGPYASGQGARTTYVTERAVFKLVDGHLHLTEIAPGIDLQRDVLDQCTARLVVSDRLSIMDRRIFRASPMGIKPIAQAAQ